MKYNGVVTESLRLPVMWMSHLCSCLLCMLTTLEWRNLLLSSIRYPFTILWIAIGIFILWRSAFRTNVHFTMDLSRKEYELKVWSIVVHSEALKIFERNCKLSFKRKFIDMMNFVSTIRIKCFEVARDFLYTVSAVLFTICDLSFSYHSGNNIRNFRRPQDEI